MEDESDCCKEECESCSCCGPAEEIDVKELGPEAVELAGMFDEINENLVNALKARQKILETLHKRSTESDEMKEKMDKVVKSRNPVLLQFVFQQ